MTTSYTLTGDFNDLLGEEPRITGAWLETNLPAGTALVDLDANKVLLSGPKRITLDASNTFSISLIATNSTGTNVTDGTLRYRVRAQYSDGTGVPRTWESGFFDLTAAADLSDKVGGAGDLDVTIAPSASLIDAPTAANITGPSQTRTALDAAYAGHGVGRFIARANAGATLKIVGLGDSILAGTGATLGTNDMLTNVLTGLQSRFPTATISQSNRAVSGATTATIAITGALTSAIADAGDLYIIGFGRNDVTVDDAAYGGAPTQGYKRARSLRYLEVMLRTIRAQVPQAEILLITENPAATYSADDNMRTYQAGVREIAAAYGAELADTYVAYGTSGYESLLADNVHPSVAGHQLYAETILARIPATLGKIGAGRAATTLAKGLRTPEGVDTTIGTYGWTVVNGSAPTSEYVQSGAGWTLTYPRETSTVNDYMEWTFTGTDFGIRVDQSEAAAPVVDIAVDGVTTFTNQSLYLVAGPNQLYQFLATALTDGQHTIRITLKSGTLRWYQAAWLAGSPVSDLGIVGGLRKMVTGRYYTQPRANSSTTCFLSSGDVYAVPLWFPKAVAVDQLGVDVTQAAAGSTITPAIYRPDGNDQPGALLATGAALDTSTTGFKTATLTGVTVPAGWNWLAFIALGGFAANALRVRGADLSSQLVASSSGTLANALNAYLDAGESALPNTWASTLGAASGPLIAVRTA